jgi:stearoyl-CoA desaturase (delta-9 desaturase)
MPRPWTSPPGTSATSRTWPGTPYIASSSAGTSLCLWHATWFVNSATHLWGYRSYATRDRSTNLWWVALLTLGEGWHNNHHAFPRSARHGLRWWELDLTYGLIRLLALVGLAGQIQVPGRAHRQAADRGVLTGGHILPG